jgi:hypothetical protein
MNKANSVYTAKELEEAFEWYYNEILVREYNGPSRHYKPGRIYGLDGTYGDQKKEDQYQIWVNDFNLVERIVEEYFYYKDYHGEPAKDAFYDSLQGSTAELAAFGAAIGAEVEDDIYPYDLLEPEPFIRAPVISAESAEIMADEFAEYYDEEDDYNEKDPYDAILERTQDPHEALREWEESDWVRNHPDPRISRIYVQATDRRY